MKKALCILLAVITFSCVTEKQRQRILKDCPVASSEKVKDSSWTKETTELLPEIKFIPGPVRYLPSPCATLCDSLGRLLDFEITTKKNGIKQTLQGIGGVLIQRADVDSLVQVNERITREINFLHSKEKETQVHDNCKLEHRTRFDGFTYWWFWITAGMILLWVIMKAVKNWLPITIIFR